MTASLRDPDGCELTILMPCLDEAETLALCIAKALAYLDASATSGEVVIADNGSRDGSQAIAQACGARVVNVPRRGYGAALMGGIAEVRGRFTVMGDADDSYDFSDLDGFRDRLREGADIVLGNRFLGGIAPGAMPFLHRYLGNPALSFLGRLFFRIPVGDFHCGLRGFRTERIRSLGLRTTGMEFASEMIVRAAIGGLRIDEVPTRLAPDGRSRKPHLKTWRDGWRHLKFLLIYSPRWLFMIPGALLTSVGTALTATFFFGPVSINGVVFDLNAFITACLIIVAGVQMVSFGILSRAFAGLAGFLPNSPRVATVVRHATIDRLAAAAAALLVAGVWFFGIALAAWAKADFGNLADPGFPRRVMLGLTLVLIAFQVFFSAFFMGMLAIPAVRPDHDEVGT